VNPFTERQGGEVVELNVQVDHMHVLALIRPKVAVSDLVGAVKGRTAIRILSKYKKLKQKPYWGNYFRTRGYCVDAVGLDEEKVRRYVMYQDEKDREKS